VQPDCPSVTPLSQCTASFARDRPCNSGWVSMGVAHESGILTSSPDGAIDHPARSPHHWRPATVLGKTRNDLCGSRLDRESSILSTKASLWPDSRNEGPVPATNGRNERRTVAQAVGRQGQHQEIGNLGSSGRSGGCKQTVAACVGSGGTDHPLGDTEMGSV